jgi:hypothetical protein
MLRPVPEGVLRFAGNFDEVPRARFNPRHLSAVFDKYFNIARKNEEKLRRPCDCGWVLKLREA